MTVEGPRHALGGKDSEAIDSFMSARSLQLSAALIFRPSEYCVRTTELISLSTEENPVRRTIREYVGLDSPVLVPIAFPQRGQLTDFIRIEQSEGVRPYALSREPTIVVMRALLLATAQATDLNPAPASLVEKICRFVPTAPTDQAMQTIDQLRKTLLAANDVGTVQLTDDQAQFVGALQFFARRQPLFIPSVPTEIALTLSFERDVPYIEMQNRSIRESFRTSVGRTPDHLRFDAPLATRSQSYHFRLRAAPDVFVRDAICLRKIRTRVRHDARHLWASYAPLSEDDARAVSGQGPNPTNLAHIQIVRGPDIAGARLGVVFLIRLAERPFGRLGAASVRLVVALGSTISLACLGSAVVAAGNATVVSALLASPALTGATIIATRTSTLTRDPLAARAGSVVAVLNALATALIMTSWTVSATEFKDQYAGKTITHYSLPVYLQVAFGINAAITLIALLVISAIAGINAFRYVRALTDYRRQSFSR